MKRAFSILLCLAFPLVATASKVELPEWGETSAAEYQLGGGLWPSSLGNGEDALDGETSAALELVGTGAASEEGEASGSGELRYFGPAGEVLSETEAAEIAAAAALFEEDVEELFAEELPAIEGELKDHYFAHRPMDFLVDPQRLLTEQKSNDIMRFLEFHADESEIEIFVMVLGETQNVPSDIDLQLLHREWFSEQPTVLMVYYRERPELTEFVYNEGIRSALPRSVFDRMHQNCLREGAATDLAPDQVERMAIELSIQLYWLSRLMAQDGSAESVADAAMPLHELPATAGAPELLREYAPGLFLEESGQQLLSMVLSTLFVLVLIALCGAVFWGILWWRNYDRVAGSPLLFPSFHVVPRLGGEYSGGSFVGMSFELTDR